MCSVTRSGQAHLMEEPALFISGGFCEYERALDDYLGRYS